MREGASVLEQRGRPWRAGAGRGRTGRLLLLGWLGGLLAVLSTGPRLAQAWIKPLARPARPVGNGATAWAGRSRVGPAVGGRWARARALSATRPGDEYPVVTVRRGYADFRSDTVTKPTPDMRKAMAKAEVGDDVYREDPTVDQLEREVAAMMGHEAALFVPSRTMGNLIAIMIWCSARGSSFICGEKSHIFLCEEGGAAQFGGVSPFPIPNEPNGTLDINKILQAILDDNEVAQLITLENPVDRCGGRVMPMEYMDTVAQLAKEHNMKLHLDGSRIWNAAAHLGVDVKELTGKADSVTVCVSKGLGAPAGSLLIGSRAFVEKARKMRKALGGAMRQVGVLAAAGLVALKKTLPRITDDHEHAKKLARGLAAVPGLKVDVNSVETNIVFVDVDERMPANVTGAFLIDELSKKGVLALAIGPKRLRLVTHYEVTDADVRKAIVALDQIMQPFANDLRQAKIEEEAAAAAAASQAAVAAAAAAAAAMSIQVAPSVTIVATAAAPPSAAESKAPAAQASDDQAASAAAAAAAPAAAAPAATTTMAVAADASASPSATSTSLAEAGPAVIDTTATTVASQPAPAANAGDEEEAEEVSVYGRVSVAVLDEQQASTCEEGFVLVLSQPLAQATHDAPSPRALKVLVTPCDPMSCGLDVTQAETPEAVTVLQLLQDIDVGSYLRHDTLAGLVGVKAGHPMALRRVLIQQAAVGNKKFRARLEVEVSEQNSTTSAAGPVRGEEGGPTPTVSGTMVYAEVKEPFQAMALALRYSAKIWVASRLLRESSVSFDVRDLRSVFPDLLEIKPGMKQSATTIDLDVAYEIGRLERQLQTAMDEGNEAAQLRIKRQLSLYSTSLEEDLTRPMAQEQLAAPKPAEPQQPPPAPKQAQPEAAAAAASSPELVSASDR